MSIHILYSTCWRAALKARRSIHVDSGLPIASGLYVDRNSCSELNRGGASPSACRDWQVGKQQRKCFNREDASSIVIAGATANTTEGSSRASRESGLLCFTFTWGVYR